LAFEHIDNLEVVELDVKLGDDNLPPTTNGIFSPPRID